MKVKLIVGKSVENYRTGPELERLSANLLVEMTNCLQMLVVVAFGRGINLANLANKYTRVLFLEILELFTTFVR